MDMLQLLESALAEWSQSVAGVMQRESQKRPAHKGPLAEIEFWRERNAVLSSLHEQLNLPAFKRVIALLEEHSDDRNLMAAFKSQLSELAKLASEARDNVKFLGTLERHFKNIAQGPLVGILDTLPPMMNALRMVWIISRHYSDDQRMGSLFQRIGREVRAASRGTNGCTRHGMAGWQCCALCIMVVCSDCKGVSGRPVRAHPDKPGSAWRQCMSYAVHVPGLLVKCMPSTHSGLQFAMLNYAVLMHVYFAELYTSLACAHSVCCIATHHP